MDLLKFWKSVSICLVSGPHPRTFSLRLESGAGRGEHRVSEKCRPEASHVPRAGGWGPGLLLQGLKQQPRPVPGLGVGPATLRFPGRRSAP